MVMREEFKNCLNYFPKKAECYVAYKNRWHPN